MSRNPFTPQIGDKLSPAEYLDLYLRFSDWSDKNPVSCPSRCGTPALFRLHNAGVCCLEHTQKCVEFTQLEIVGCQSGVFTEPPGFRFWYELAIDRLAELEQGIDLVDKWTQIFESRTDLQDWIWDKSISRDEKPGFSLQGFKIACHKHHHEPDFLLVGQHFRESIEFLLNYWTQDEY